MSRRLYSHRLVRYWYSYTIEEICSLFAHLGLHPQTVRSWIKAGLQTIDSGKPILIYGFDLIQFLRRKNDQNKCALAFSEMYCMRCKDARAVLGRKIAVDQNSNFIKARGCCRECKTRMFKSFSLSTFPKIKRFFKLVAEAELYGSAIRTDKTHLEAEQQVVPNEPQQWSLFDDLEQR